MEAERTGRRSWLPAALACLPRVLRTSLVLASFLAALRDVGGVNAVAYEGESSPLVGSLRSTLFPARSSYNRMRWLPWFAWGIPDGFWFIPSMLRVGNNTGIPVIGWNLNGCHAHVVQTHGLVLDCDIEISVIEGARPMPSNIDPVQWSEDCLSHAPSEVKDFTRHERIMKIDGEQGPLISDHVEANARSSCHANEQGWPSANVPYMKPPFAARDINEEVLYGQSSSRGIDLSVNASPCHFESLLGFIRSALRGIKGYQVSRLRLLKCLIPLAYLSAYVPEENNVTYKDKATNDGLGVTQKRTKPPLGVFAVMLALIVAWALIRVIECASPADQDCERENGNSPECLTGRHEPQQSIMAALDMGPARSPALSWGFLFLEEAVPATKSAGVP